MADQEDLVQRLALLEEEVNSLKARLATLENQAGPVSSPGEDTDANIRAKQAGRKKHSAGKRHPHGRSLHDTILTKDGLESLIGGQLLNRIGIIILLFGVAYFLKYAFDNGWINQTGRIVIGLIAGVSLLTAGDMAMSRKYTYFSQGLTGGGIAVIYLTTFAAANYYQIFSPLVAFVLLVITALAGGFYPSGKMLMAWPLYPLSADF
ncbi:MAG: hypothetical protein A4E53_03906 [Pelotomaculum sp. PtaB.Bin104]|nr:MAG: hypothetical protein A4E53_03906 [Pelotomaculum sp. PtaB.Bin104]